MESIPKRRDSASLASLGGHHNNAPSSKPSKSAFRSSKRKSQTGAGRRGNGSFSLGPPPPPVVTKMTLQEARQRMSVAFLGADTSAFLIFEDGLV